MSRTLWSMSFLLSLALSAAAWVDQACGQTLKLDDRVAPPQTVAVPPLAYVSQPAPKPATARDTRARVAWQLPIGEVPRSPAAIKDEQRPTTWRHPALDQPLVASAERPTLPVETRLPQVAGSAARGPNPDQPLAEIRTAHETELLPKLNVDPKALVAFRYLTHPVAAPPPQPAPLLRLTIPDPFATLVASRLPTADLDHDPPIVPLARPAPPAR